MNADLLTPPIQDFLTLNASELVMVAMVLAPDATDLAMIAVSTIEGSSQVNPAPKFKK